MKRRDFIKQACLMVSGVASGTLFTIGSTKPVYSNVHPPPKFSDLVGVMGGEPAPMFDKGIQALGGIRRFVKPNQTVVIKPNIGWDKEPQYAANTNPDLVGQIVAQCLDAGAKKVFVFDHTAHVWSKCYENSGIKNAVKKAGGEMVSGNSKRYYQKIQVQKGKILKSAKAHELFLESDVFINVPVLKNHMSTQLTIGMKNLMGVVWDRGWWHSHDLHQCIADFSTFRIPDLTVVDAYRIMKTNGPMGVSVNDAALMKSLIISPDPVAADAASAKLFGMNPVSIPYIKMASEMGVGTMNLANLDISRIKMK